MTPSAMPSASAPRFSGRRAHDLAKLAAVWFFSAIVGPGPMALTRMRGARDCASVVVIAASTALLSV